MGLDSSQACINFCSGYSVFLEAHLQAIINSLECWQNIQTCRQASDDTALGKSSGSGPKPERGGERERGFSPPCLLATPGIHTDQRGGGGASEPTTAPHSGLLHHAQPPIVLPEGVRVLGAGGVKGPEDSSPWLPPGSALKGH